MKAILGGLSSLPHWVHARSLLLFHSKQKPKNIGFNFLEFNKNIVYLIYANWVSIIYYWNTLYFPLFLSTSKNMFLFEVLAKIYREWPPHGSMRIKLNLLANSSICCITCLALSWVSSKLFKYHKFQLNLWWHEICILNVIDPKSICLWNEWVKGNIVKLNHNLLDVITQSMQSSICKGSSCSTS